MTAEVALPLSCPVNLRGQACLLTLGLRVRENLEYHFRNNWGWRIGTAHRSPRGPMTTTLSLKLTLGPRKQGAQVASAHEEPYNLRRSSLRQAPPGVWLGKKGQDRG